MLNTTNYLAFWGDIQGPKEVERHYLWISVNEFYARLTKANVSDWTYNDVILCHGHSEDHKLGKNPSDYDVDLLKLAQKFHKNHTLFTVALSAAAQHMIHAALSLYTEKAETVENIKARNDTLSAVVAIDIAERPYK